MSYPAIILAIGVLTALYTYVGGFKAVVWMDVVQMSVYVLGALFTLFLLWSDIGGQAMALLGEAGKLKTFRSQFPAREIPDKSLHDGDSCNRRRDILDGVPWN